MNHLRFKEKIMKNKNDKVTTYKMSRVCYDRLLKTRKGEDEKRMNPNKFVCLYVNQTYGLKQEVTQIIVEG